MGIGLSVVKKDTKQRFINYELSAGIDFNNLTFINAFYNYPFKVDWNMSYIHRINTYSIPVVLSIKKVIRKSNRFQPYFGTGIVPCILFSSRTKIFYNDSLVLKGQGIRLSHGEWFKLYDLFYIGIEYKKIDFRIKTVGMISQEKWNLPYYYYYTERIIKNRQCLLEILIPL